MKNTLLSIAIASSLSLSACVVAPEKNEAYWQRTDASSALHLRGPKAQHSLNKNIADCVVEIKELVRLNSLRISTKADTGIRRSDTAPIPGTVARFDTPDYDGPSYADYQPYTDFEGCMDYKGWERVSYVPYKVQEDAQENYIRTLVNPRYNSGLEAISVDSSEAQATEYKKLND